MTMPQNEKENSSLGSQLFKHPQLLAGILEFTSFCEFIEEGDDAGGEHHQQGKKQKRNSSKTKEGSNCSQKFLRPCSMSTLAALRLVCSETLNGVDYFIIDATSDALFFLISGKNGLRQREEEERLLLESENGDGGQDIKDFCAPDLILTSGEAVARLRHAEQMELRSSSSRAEDKSDKVSSGQQKDDKKEQRKTAWGRNLKKSIDYALQLVDPNNILMDCLGGIPKTQYHDDDDDEEAGGSRLEQRFLQLWPGYGGREHLGMSAGLHYLAKGISPENGREEKQQKFLFQLHVALEQEDFDFDPDKFFSSEEAVREQLTKYFLIGGFHPFFVVCERLYALLEQKKTVLREGPGQSQKLKLARQFQRLEQSSLRYFEAAALSFVPMFKELGSDDERPTPGLLALPITSHLGERRKRRKEFLQKGTGNEHAEEEEQHSTGTKATRGFRDVSRTRGSGGHPGSFQIGNCYFAFSDFMHILRKEIKHVDVTLQRGSPSLLSQELFMSDSGGLETFTARCGNPGLLGGMPGNSLFANCKKLTVVDFTGLTLFPYLLGVSNPPASTIKKIALPPSSGGGPPPRSSSSSPSSYGDLPKEEDSLAPLLPALTKEGAATCRIGAWFMAGCTSLKQIKGWKVFNPVTSIGSGFLDDCVALEEAHLGEFLEVQLIGTGFMDGCKNLKRVTLHEGVEIPFATKHTQEEREIARTRRSQETILNALRKTSWFSPK